MPQRHADGFSLLIVLVQSMRDATAAVLKSVCVVYGLEMYDVSYSTEIMGEKGILSEMNMFCSSDFFLLLSVLELVRIVQAK